MARKNIPGWLSWVALAAAAAIVPACNMSGGGGNGNGNLIWKTISGGGGAPAPTGLVWRDVNLGPISGGGGLGGDMTFEGAGEIDITNGVATTNPFKGDLHPVSTALPQNATFELNLESDVQSLYALYVRNQGLGGLGGGGLGGGLGGGFGGGFNILPMLNSEPKIRLEARADCENCAIQNTANPSENGVNPPNTLMWRLLKCGLNPNITNPTSVGPGMAASDMAFWNANAAAIQTRLKAIQGSGYMGAGYWTLNNNQWWAVVIVDLPLGQIP